MAEILPPQLEVFRASLPAKPYCTDNPKYGVKIRSAESAIRYKLIQPNHPDSIRWMGFDLDSKTAVLDWQDLNCPPPNILTMNRENGHAHLLYGIADPVHVRHGDKEARRHPLRYAASIDIALTRQLGADPGYSKLLTKNPLHEYWETMTPRVQPYDLAELADYVDMTPYRDTRKNLPAVGLGRNCTLFDNLRQWSYKAIRTGDWLGADFWEWAVIGQGEKYNADFDSPLLFPEIKATGRSIARWVWMHMSPEGFCKWAENRRKKSQRVRSARSQEKAVVAREMRQKGMKQREIAEALKINQSQVSRLLRT